MECTCEGERRKRQVLQDDTERGALRNSLAHPSMNGIQRPMRLTHRTVMSPLRCVLLLIFATICTRVDGTISYYDTPEVLWSTSLGDNVELQMGNAITVDPIDSTIYITTSTGSLFVRSAVSGHIVKTVNAPPIESFQPKTSYDASPPSVWTTSCSSRAEIGTYSDGYRFLILSLVDHPPSGSVATSKSRIVAYSLPDMQLLWETKDLPGEVQGAPVVMSTQNGDRLIAFTQSEEIRIQVAPDSPAWIGHFSLIDTNDGQIVWAEVETNVDGRNGPTAGFGPIGIARNPILGKYEGGSHNTNDLLVFTSKGGDGSVASGYTFAFQLPTDFLQATPGNLGELLHMQYLKDVRWTSITRPVLSADGLSLFVGVSKSELRAWVGLRGFDTAANWEASIAATEEDKVTAMQTAPVLSKDETMVYASSNSSNVVCMDAKTGKMKWRLSGTSPFVPEFQVAADNRRVYGLQSADGKLLIMNHETSEHSWWSHCSAIDGDCLKEVHAGFALSNSGDTLYVADNYGQLMAFQLGESQDENDAVRTEPPSEPQSPVIIVESSEDTASPSSNANSNGDTNVIRNASIALIVIASIIGVGSALYIAGMHRIKTFPQPHGHEDPLAFEGSLDPESAIVPDASSKTADSKLGALYGQTGTAERQEQREQQTSILNPAFDDTTATQHDALIIEDYSYGASVVL